ncbi:ImmA/IrrE family metallo-endopeptidase [Bifidobacterium adolescentis]|uniref:ImmA/IrrE family metallo-endopeptidase n=1 Tax=Bifidobacterium adolescentis TaxID=1680 RepID=UPI0022E0DE12|nr:ImmA/IrrE family metallo-endopeptidase [Bifidobacterium adolescentis]
MSDKLLWQDAREKAQAVLDKYWDGKYPVKIAAISEAMGVTPHFAQLPDKISGLIVKSPGQESADSYADVSESVVRRRFTLSHELGHYVERVTLGRDEDFSFVERREPGKYDLHEFYADEFAGSLLMPSNDFKQKVESDGIISAAQYFGVSLAAAQKRLERLEKHRD